MPDTYTRGDSTPVQGPSVQRMPSFLAMRTSHLIHPAAPRPLQAYRAELWHLVHGRDSVLRVAR